MRGRTTIVLLAVALVATIAGLGVGQAQVAVTGSGVVGSDFVVTPGDLAFILQQIKIAEHHAATFTADNPCGTLVGDGPNQIPDRLTPYGLRTVDGSCNNLFPDREKFGAADTPFPRLTNPLFRDAEAAPAGFPAQASSSYKQKKGFVYDSQPRVISNLIVDQTSTNPAAVAAAAFPVRTQGNTGVFACGAPGAPPPPDCVPPHKTLFIENVTTDVGLSPPFNSMFTFFGQFFDHGVDQTVKSGGTVFVPLRADDPLRTVGPDGVAGTGDEVPASQAFMVLTRAQNQPGPDGILGDNPATPADESADDIQNAPNTDSPWVDQSQTYTSHSSHQVFLREYALNAAGRPVDTGKFLGGLNHTADTAGPLPGIDGRDGISTWEAVKLQAASVLGLRLEDKDVTNVPMLAADPYGNFIPGPRGLPQYVTSTGLVEGNLASPVPVPANVRYFDTPFLTDVAHNADPSPRDTDNNPATPPVAPSPDGDNVASADFAHQPAGTYDDELLNAHFICGDGRCNENIALSAVHQIFHSEHNRLVDYIKGVLLDDAANTATGAAALPEWRLASGASGWNGSRLFQAARFATEMQYQHLVFEEFARKMVPSIRPFHVYNPDINPSTPAEFAHAAYRFGHSMLNDGVARKVVDPVSGNDVDNDVPLLTAFLNPPEFFNGGPAGKLTPKQAAGSIFMGGVDLPGNEIDEFVVETLRNNLLGLPLDLPSLNLARARDAGIPPLNILRKQIFQATGNGLLAPYKSWADYGNHLKHPESLINFVAAYGKHPTIRDAGPNGTLGDGDDVTTVEGKRNAARAIVDPLATDPVIADRFDFMQSAGAWANNADGSSKTGLDEVDVWVGGLAEVTSINGPLLGSTLTYIFQTTLEQLQDFDRLYYLNRTPGMNLRAQLESNSFAEMVQRNTENTHGLKADVFSTADCKFELGNLNGTAAQFLATGSTVTDDPTSECDESLVLTRAPDGSISYKQRNTVDPPGINAQAVYAGTPNADRVNGGNDNDTFWGNQGDDVIDGQQGDDVVRAGAGDDKITDLDGADDLSGGPDDDAIEGGTGDDLLHGGDGQDLLDGGPNDNETFGGPGTDFIQAGAGADAAFGDGGSDWIEGGTGQDLLQGDHSAFFFDDPGESWTPGHDVFVGQPGENDYDTEGGDDIMSQNAAIDRNAGAGGFDWAIHQYDTVGADDDMMINNNLGNVLPVVVNRDRWQETEADSGSPFDDVIRGTDIIHQEVGGAGFTGCDVLDQAGVDRIAGLNQIVPQPLTGDLAAVEALAATFNHKCPLSGPIWGEGDIILGGGGNDTLEGRSANDIIDGDRALHVAISVRNAAGQEIGRADMIEHQYLRDAAGNLTGPTLQDAVQSGQVDGANLRIVREIVDEDGAATGSDTAVFKANRADYVITVTGTGAARTVIVSQVSGLAPPGRPLNDDTDTLRNIEFLHFADGTVPTPTVSDLQPTVSLSATSIAFGNVAVGTTSATRSVTLTNTGTAPLNFAKVAIEGTPDGVDFSADFLLAGDCVTGGVVAVGGSCTANITFTPSVVGPEAAELQFEDNATGSPHIVSLTGNGTPAPAPAVTTAPTAAAGLSFAAEIAGAGGSSSTLPVTVSNTGNAPLTVTSLTIAGLDFSVASSTCLAAPVAAGGSCTVNVRFAPTANGTRTSALSIASNAAGSPHSIPLSGVGAAASNLTGNQAIEAKADNNVAGAAEAFRTVAAQTGSVRQLRIYVDTGTTATTLRAGLYAHNATTNRPGALLTSGQVTGLTAGQFNTVPVPAVTVNAGTTYWVGMLGTGGTLRFRVRATTGAANAVMNGAAGLTALPNTWQPGGAVDSTSTALSGWAAGILSTTPAPPPPPPPAPGLSVLLGNAATEAKVDSNVAGLAEAFKTTADTTGSVTRLRVFVDAGSTAGSVVVGLYSNNAANHPGTLLTSGTIAAPAAGQNNEVTVPAASVTAGQTYWIAVLGPTGTLKFRDRGAVGAGNSETSAQANLTSLPASWTTGASFADGLLSAVGLG